MNRDFFSLCHAGKGKGVMQSLCEGLLLALSYVLSVKNLVGGPPGWQT